MVEKIKNKFQENPTLYYALSVCATWAGIGSLMNGVTMTQTLGYIPSLIWVIGNVAACIVFGLFALKIPKVREVFGSKLMKYICGVMCIFQAWLSLNGTKTVFEDTPLGGNYGMALGYVMAIAFLFILLKYGMIRNVLTDGIGWIVVYVLAAIVTAFALISSRGNFNAIASGIDNPAHMKEGIWKAILLLPGPFTYPYFFEILNYNEKNEDGTKKVLNIQKAFTWGGIFFGIYMAIIFGLAWAKFPPVLSVLKAFLITIIGASTLSSSMYSIYIAFGKKVGLVINALMIALWAVLIPLGVMGMWTLMASVRIYFVGGAILFAIGWRVHEKRTNKNILRDSNRH